MAPSAEEDQGKGGGRGFSSLSSLVSSVDETSLPAGKQEEASGRSRSTPSGSAKPTAPKQIFPTPTQERDVEWPLALGIFLLPYIFAWALLRKGHSAIARVLGFGWLSIYLIVFLLPTNQSATVPGYTPPAPVSAYSAAPTEATPAPEQPQVPEAPQAPTRPAEDLPPIGRDLVLSAPQIRYCVAEEIRLDGARSVVNNYNESQVGHFNQMIDDYNSRCGQFHYMGSSLEDARRDVEPWRSALRIEGSQRIASLNSEVNAASPQADQAVQSSSATEPTAATSAAAGSPSLSSVQGQESSGPESIQLSADERAAIELACIVAKSQGPSAYDGCVARQLQELQSAPRTPSLTALSYDERSAVELACITRKADGAASYNRCLVGQLEELGNAPRAPDLTGLSYDEKSAIELACITSKSQGAANYNRCEVGQLEELASAPRTPDLSGLTYQERSSIQLACITDKARGAAAYNRCLVAQMSSLGR